MFEFWHKIKSAAIPGLLKRANDFYKQKKYNKAIKLYKRILKRDSKHFAARANLATAYFEIGDFTTSIPCLLRVIKNDFANPWWHNYLAQSYQKTFVFDLALDEAWLAVELSKGAKEQELNLAYTIYEISDEKGRKFIEPILKKWYQKYPDSGIAKQCYKSFFYDKNFACSNQEYVESLFDVFAPDFDAVLSDLHYRSPQDIAAFLADYFSAAKLVPHLKILDLGCGSGLCGKYLRPKFPDSIIYGVDISSRMLEEASRKNIYKKLIKKDINDYLSSQKSKFEIIVAADVLTYFGELDSLFDNILKTLAPQGVFAFSISQNKVNSKDFFLTPSSRFVHSVKYVENLLEKRGLNIVTKEQKILRKEGEKDIVGYIILAVKP